MQRLFIETQVFKKLLDSTNMDWLEKSIKDEILKDPTKGSVIIGTGGLRKIRIAKDDSGKSGGYRVIYLDLPSVEITYLLLLFDKSVSENINSDTKKKLINLVQEIKDEIKSHKR